MEQDEERDRQSEDMDGGSRRNRPCVSHFGHGCWGVSSADLTTASLEPVALMPAACVRGPQATLLASSTAAAGAVCSSGRDTRTSLDPLRGSCCCFAIAADCSSRDWAGTPAAIAQERRVHAHRSSRCGRNAGALAIFALQELLESESSRTAIPPGFTDLRLGGLWRSRSRLCVGLVGARC